MKLFLAGGQGGWSARWNTLMSDPDMANYPFGVMSSYVWWTKDDRLRMEWAQANGRPTYLDSGAFSALTLNKTIKVDEYITFARGHRDLFDHVASLDVIHDAVASAENHQRMLDAGFENAVPCFHVNEPWEYLYAMSGAPLVGLGVGGLQSRRDSVVRWLGECFSRLAEHGATCDVHGYAITVPDWMWRFPWYSVDSSSWFMAARYARMAVLTGRTMKFYNRLNPPKRLALIKVWRKLMPPEKTTSESYFPLLRHNIKAFSTYAANVTRARESNP
jgi:hypothetical protein